MSIYNIADLNILINPLSEEIKKRLSPYITNSDLFDFEVKVSKGEIEEYIANSKERCSSFAAESTLILTQICNRILENYDGFFFHSSSFMLDNEGYVFTAVSGTGKSTHTALWRKLFKEKVVMINDDKPIIRKKDGVFYVYGTPWMGKSNIGNNVKAPVKAVYILQRGEENSAVRVKPGEVFKNILEATVVPADRKNMEKLLTLLDEFFSSVSLFRLTCNMDIEAAQVAYDADDNIFPQV
ncbi:MAG: hypothetical protein ACI4XI_06770 [Ruminococcus sp.]